MDLDGLTLHQLRVFQTVARTSSFTAASGELHLSQSVVSRTVQIIERRIRVELFRRTSRSVEITPAGIELLAIVDRTIATHRSGLERFERFLDGAEGTVSIAALPSLAATIVPQMALSFAEAWPQIAVAISDGLANEIIEWLETGRADIGLTAEAPDVGGLEQNSWMSDELVALVPADHPIAALDAVGWSDLAAFQLIGLAEGSSVRHLTDAGFTQAGVRLRHEHVVRSPMVVHGMVASGLGVAAMPASLAQLAPSGSTVTVPLVHPTVRRQIVVATPVGGASSPAAQRFTRYVLDSPPAAESSH